MSQPKDYDSTLARIAGNIAAGMMGSPHLGAQTNEWISDNAVRLAENIIARCRELKAQTPTEPGR